MLLARLTGRPLVGLLGFIGAIGVLVWGVRGMVPPQREADDWVDQSCLGIVK
jgi:hypothetical protein